MNSKPLMLVLVVAIGFNLIFPFATAAPPFQQSTVSDTGTFLEIIYPKFEAIQQNSNFSFHIHLFNSTGYPLYGNNASCNAHLYNQSGKHIQETQLKEDSNGVDYYFVITEQDTATLGDLSILLTCYGNNSFKGYYGWISEGLRITQNGKVDSVAPTGVLAMLVIAPLLAALLLILVAAQLNPKQHEGLRIFLGLLSFPSLIVSLNFATSALSQYYNFTFMQEGIGKFVYWFTWVFIIVLFYWLLFIFIMAVRKAASNKRL